MDNLVVIKGDNKEVQRILLRLLNNYCVDNGRVIVKTRDVFGYETDLLALSSKYYVEGKPISNLKTNLLSKAINEGFTEEKNSPNEIRRIIERLYRENLDIRKRDWNCIFPINIDPISLAHRRLLNVNCNKFKISRWDKVKKIYNFELWFRQANLFMDSNTLVSELVPLEITIEARTAEEAKVKGEKAFNRLSSLINFTNIGLRSRLSFGEGRTKLRNKIIPPPTFCVFDSEFSNPLTYREFILLNAYKREKISKEHFVKVKKLDKKLSNNQNNELLILASNCLEIYNLAFNSLYEKTSFLLLWQICEMIALNPRANHLVAENIRILIRKHKIQLQDYIKVAYNIRNQFVHEGEFPAEGEKAVNLIKAIVDYAILELLNLSSSFNSSNQLRALYRLGSQENPLSADDVKIMNYLIKTQ